ncbi:hypothetical protein XA68_10141 [Ophiocordyceps unilateralis]|uniref:EKC/KEOPS complex subunit BUD32 n=1 Tax=Ophiocordyceps unilateralis TaxID=268505 RepID=A0A2A9PJ97_OPHUN|nr:hypothetical protein XA68_10141 [Ophiocordyceps unilateralis]
MENVRSNRSFDIENFGLTCTIEPIWPGVVLKQPKDWEPIRETVDLCFSAEPLIFEKLGQHPRIVRYLGLRGRGLLLGQASHGNLQTYIDTTPSISLRQRVLWCRQLTEAVCHIHSRGVVHSDLRPQNVLVHESTPGSRDLLVCDFGGSACEELGLNGGNLPDGPFYHPVFDGVSSSALDIFSLGSLFYTVLTGCWPYRSTPGRPEILKEAIAYEEEIAEALNQGKYPDLKGIVGGTVILACWTRQYGTAEEVLRALEREMPVPEVEAELEEANHSFVLLGTAMSIAAAAALTYILMQRQVR